MNSAPTIVADINRQLRVFMDNSPAACWMKDSQGRHVYLSAQYLEKIGVRSDWFGKTDDDIWPADVAERFRKEDQRVLLSGEAIRFEDIETFTSPDQQVRSWLVNKFPITDEFGSRYVGGIAIEITEQKLAEEALQVQYQMNESMIQTARNVVLVLDPQQRITRFNPFLQQLLGCTVDAVKGKHWRDVLQVDDDVELIRSDVAQAGHDRRARGFITSIRTPVGEDCEIEWYNSQLTKEDVEPAGYLCMGVDVTERRLLERAIDDIAAREQRRIGQDLHDSVGQEMTVLSLLTASLNEQVKISHDAGSIDAEAYAAITLLGEKIDRTLQSANKNVQTLSRGMLPDPVDTDGLVAKLSAFVDFTTELRGIQCHFRCQHRPKLADGAIATHLYRIAQEATNNAIKHSQCDSIEIALKSIDNQIALEISDNGRGINHASGGAGQPGMGLKIMQYRAELIGATLTIGPVSLDGSPDCGTKVQCLIKRSTK